MAILREWVRVDLRRRRRSLAVLTLLVALASGTVMAAVAGANRGDSALDRLKQRTLPAHAAIVANTPNFDWAPVRALPEVEALGFFGPQFPVDGMDGMVAEPALGDGVMSDLERPVVRAGRMFDRSRTDEAVVGPGFLEQWHLRLGDAVSVVLPTPAELQGHAGSGPGGAYTGPRLTVRLVAVVNSSWWGDPGAVYLSPGVATRYRDNVAWTAQTPPGSPYFANALVRLVGGTASITRLRSDFARVTGRADIEILDLAQWSDLPALQQTSFESRCLLGFGAAALLASLFLVGQAAARSAAAAITDLEPLLAVGMIRLQPIAAAATLPAIAGVIGAALGVAAAIGASRWFPIGLAERIEPDPGTFADGGVLVLGALATILLTAAAAASGWLTVAARGGVPVGSRSGMVAGIRRAGLPVPVLVGARFALEPGAGRTAVPVRAAMAGAVIGVLGLLAAFTFARGVADVAGHPDKFGQTFQLSAFVGDNGEESGPTDRLLAALDRNPDLLGVEDARSAVATGAGGSGSVTLYSYRAEPKPLPTVVTSGRMPRSADEVLLAPRSLEALHAKLSDHVQLTGSKGTATFTVTGTGLVPAGPHNTYADGGWLSEAGYDALFTGWKFRAVHVTLRPSARTPDAGERLKAALTQADPELAPFDFAPPAPVREATALEEVRLLPVLLGTFLGLLAVGAVGHALVTAVRRRRHDLAVLRALGMTRPQSLVVVLTQSLVLAGVGLVFGVPLGVALGRMVWQAVAGYTPFQYDPPVAALALLLVGPATLAAAGLLAAWPGWRAARLRVAQVLRTE